MANHFQVGQNYGNGQQWKLYYLYGLERAGRLGGLRFFGQHDWYRLGAEELVHEQNKLSGFWQGALVESDKTVATSFALLFLAKGRAPVLVNKLRHGPRGDWNNDPDDVRNIVSVVSRDWKSLLTWQVVDPAAASVADLLQAPIVFFNGHQAPEFNAMAQQNLREFVEQGGFIFADACCSSPDFDAGFKELMKKIFPEEEFKLRPLSEDHPVWRAKHLLTRRTPSRSGASSTAAAPSSSIPPRTSPATGTRPNARPPTRPSSWPPRSARTSSTTPPARSSPPTSWSVREVHDFKADHAKRSALADRQAAARRRLERGAPGGAQPDGRPAQAPLVVRRGGQPQGALPQRPQPDLLPA